MKKHFFIILLFGIHLSLNAQVVNDYAKYVNPFIGTGGHGHTYPGPALPFGMIQPGPDTRLEGWDGCSGYHYTDKIVYGFSQTHLSGTGIPDYCDFLLMPTTGEIAFKKEDYASEFLKKNEKAAPGYYTTFLEKYQIKAEITTGLRNGLYKFTYPKGNKSNIIIDLTHRDKVLDSWIEIVNDREIKGYRKSSAWSKSQELYFHLVFDTPFIEAGIADNDQLKKGIKKLKSLNTKLYVRFNTTQNQTITTKIAISAVDPAGALKNLNSEFKDLNFESAKSNARSVWNKELSKIAAKDKSEKKLTIFYTALYHSLLNPNLYIDVDRRYRGLDKKIHVAKDFDYYTIFSLWDTYRTEHPLLTLIDRKRTLDFIKTFLAMYEQGGQLPIWPLGEEETFCMIGNHAIPVIVDAYAKGIRDFDVELALKAMKHSVNRKQFGLDVYRDFGAVMADKEHESASKTVEYAYDDWCIAQFAKMLGKKDDYITYLTRAQNWKNVYDPSTGHIRARYNGGWWKPFNPTEVNNNYTEGNSWHYSFSTQQDVNGHIFMMGGHDKYYEKLNELFTTKAPLTGRDQSDITGLIGQYAHGNEPSHHMAYLFNFTNHPEKTQYYVNKILNEQYSDQPDGLSGNEDCGQMSAWLVMSSMGIYPFTPGNNMYQIGTPWLDEITLNFENKCQFTFVAKGRTDANYYFNGMILNNNPYSNLYVDYSEIKDGGSLVFNMTSSPNKEYLKGLKKPEIHIYEHLIVPNPIIDGPQETFKGTAIVTLDNAEKGTTLFYTLDGTVPSKQSKKYTEPIKIDKTTVIKAIAYKDGLKPSYVSIAKYKLIETNYKIEINSAVNDSYTGGGNDALIDGVRGELNWRVGNKWQGYWGKDFEAVVDLEKSQKITSISLGAIQDTNAWIIFPTTTTFYISEDNKNFKQVAVVKSPAKPEDYTLQIKDITANVNASARYIKIIAKNFGTLPEWHEGKGGLAHLFFDEINIK